MANTFNKRAIIALTRLGDIYCPKNGEFPAYSEVAGTGKFNDLVEFVPEDDFSSLNLVLVLISFLPGFLLKWLVGVMERSMNNPSDGIIPSTLRQMNLGIRGLVYSTYYSELTNPAYQGKKPIDILGYEVNKVVD